MSCLARQWAPNTGSSRWDARDGQKRSAASRLLLYPHDQPDRKRPDDDDDDGDGLPLCA